MAEKRLWKIHYIERKGTAYKSAGAAAQTLNHSLKECLPFIDN